MKSSNNINNLGTFSPLYIKTIIETAKLKGVDVNLLYNFLEVDKYELDSSHIRICSLKTLHLLKLIIKESGDYFFGLNLGQQFKPGTFESLGYAIMSATNLREAILTNIKYQPLTQQLGKTFLYNENDNKTAILEWRVNYNDQQLLRPINEAVFSGYICLGKWMIWQEQPLQRVEFQHTRPKQINHYTNVFNCPVSFNSNRNAMHFSSDFLDLPLQQSNHELSRLMLGKVEEKLNGLSAKSSLKKKVLAFIDENMDTKVPLIQDTAKYLGCHERTLRRRLNNENTSYKELINEQKMKKARKLLMKKDLDLVDIANALGYQDQSSFCRAFRSWFQTSPRQFRHSN